MKRVILLLLVLYLCSGCTVFTPPRTLGEEVWNSDCETVDCVIEKYDEVITNNPESKGRQWDWREGYKDTPLSVLKENGRLTIKEISPAWLLLQIPTTTFIFGYVEWQAAETGDIYDCTAHYMPIPGWKFFLVHELMHCQGYMERSYIDPGAWLVNAQDGYTLKQIEIMKSEGVDRWYDTAYYKSEDNTWHDR